MQMTPKEIMSSYCGAANPKAQISILADLNLCSREEIIKILEEQGQVVKRKPGRPKKGSGKKESDQAAGAMEPEQATVVTEARLTAEMEPGQAAEVIAIEARPAAGVKGPDSGTGIPDIVKQAITKEMCLAQDRIDIAWENVKQKRELLRQAELELKRREEELETLAGYVKGKAYAPGKVAPVQQGGSDGERRA